MNRAVCALICLAIILTLTLVNLVAIEEIAPGHYSRNDEGIIKTIVIVDPKNAVLYNFQNGVRLTYPLVIKNNSFYNRELGLYKFKILGKDLVVETGVNAVTYRRE